MWILGPIRTVSATLERVSDLEIDVEDVAQLQLDFASGAQGVLSLDYLDRSYDRGCRIVGSEGTVAWSWPEGRVTLHASDRPPTSEAVPRDVIETYTIEMRAFVEAATSGRRASTTAEEGRASLCVVEAARDSAAGSRRVPTSLA